MKIKFVVVPYGWTVKSKGVKEFASFAEARQECRDLVASTSIPPTALFTYLEGAGYVEVGRTSVGVSLWVVLDD